MARLRGLAHPAISEVRGLGLLVGVAIDPAVADARRVCEALAAEGVLTKDTHHTVVRFAPPLIIETPQIDLAVDALQRALKRLSNGRPRKTLC